MPSNANAPWALTGGDPQRRAGGSDDGRRGDHPSSLASTSSSGTGHNFNQLLNTDPQLDALLRGNAPAVDMSAMMGLGTGGGRGGGGTMGSLTNHVGDSSLSPHRQEYRPISAPPAKTSSYPSFSSASISTNSRLQATAESFSGGTASSGFDESSYSRFGLVTPGTGVGAGTSSTTRLAPSASTGGIGLGRTSAGASAWDNSGRGGTGGLGNAGWGGFNETLATDNNSTGGGSSAIGGFGGGAGAGGVGDLPSSSHHTRSMDNLNTFDVFRGRNGSTSPMGGGGGSGSPLQRRAPPPPGFNPNVLHSSASGPSLNTVARSPSSGGGMNNADGAAPMGHASPVGHHSHILSRPQSAAAIGTVSSFGGTPSSSLMRADARQQEAHQQQPNELFAMFKAGGGGGGVFGDGGSAAPAPGLLGNLSASVDRMDIASKNPRMKTGSHNNFQLQPQQRGQGGDPPSAAGGGLEQPETIFPLGMRRPASTGLIVGGGITQFPGQQRRLHTHLNRSSDAVGKQHAIDESQALEESTANATFNLSAANANKYGRSLGNQMATLMEQAGGGGGGAAGSSSLMQQQQHHQDQQQQQQQNEALRNQLSFLAEEMDDPKQQPHGTAPTGGADAVVADGGDRGGRVTAPPGSTYTPRLTGGGSVLSRTSSGDLGMNLRGGGGATGGGGGGGGLVMGGPGRNSTGSLASYGSASNAGASSLGPAPSPSSTAASSLGLQRPSNKTLMELIQESSSTTKTTGLHPSTGATDNGNPAQGGFGRGHRGEGHDGSLDSMSPEINSSQQQVSPSFNALDPGSAAFVGESQQQPGQYDYNHLMQSPQQQQQTYGMSLQGSGSPHLHQTYPVRVASEVDSPYQTMAQVSQTLHPHQVAQHPHLVQAAHGTIPGAPTAGSTTHVVLDQSGNPVAYQTVPTYQILYTDPATGVQTIGQAAPAQTVLLQNSPGGHQQVFAAPGGTPNMITIQQPSPGGGAGGYYQTLPTGETVFHPAATTSSPAPGMRGGQQVAVGHSQYITMPGHPAGGGLSVLGGGIPGQQPSKMNHHSGGRQQHSPTNMRDGKSKSRRNNGATPGAISMGGVSGGTPGRRSPKLGRRAPAGGRGSGKHPTSPGQHAPDGLDMVSVGPYSSVLEEFKSSRNSKRDHITGQSQTWTVHDIQGHVVEFCQDQNGSRFLQSRLDLCIPGPGGGENMAEGIIVLEELMQGENFTCVKNDVFGNYVVQKLLERGNCEMRERIKDKVLGEMFSLSLQMYGCRVIQKVLETLEEEHLLPLLSEFHGHVLELIRDQNGNHVCQKIIEVLSTKAKKVGAMTIHGSQSSAEIFSGAVEFIVADVLDNVEHLSCHPYGCRVLQRMLEHCVPFQKSRTLRAIGQCHESLLDDQYGNYVIQHVLQFGTDDDRDSILKLVLREDNGVLKLSRQKFASNVVEKLLQYGSSRQRNAIVTEMLKVANEPEGDDGGPGSAVVLFMVRDPYANYVVQTTLDVITEGDERQKLLEVLNANSEQLRNYTFAKHIVSKLCA